MEDFLRVMAWPLLACLVLAGIHAYLGLHVIQRQVIFVDLALAQTAALGAGLALAAGYGMESGASYLISLVFTLAGAGIFSLTRFRTQRIPQEALIGIVYAVSAALLFLVLSRSGEGDEHLRQALVGNVLLARPLEVAGLFLLYSAVGVFHFVFREPFFRISADPEEASRRGLNVKLWDFLFYASFGVVVTSSVRVAGVLLVFAFLVVPAACATLFFDASRRRLVFGWAVGFLASFLGMGISYVCDLPTGASVVCVLGALLGVCLLFFKAGAVRHSR